MRIKICGLTGLDDVRAAVAVGADWVGLNFHPPSPRYVNPETASAIVMALPASVEAVGLFVNRPPAEVAAVAERVGLSLVQLHGDEPPEDLAALPETLRVVRAIRLGDVRAIDRMIAELEAAERLGRPPYAVLIDAYVSGQLGGTGRTIGDDLLDHLPHHPRLILAGGLTPENVAERIARVRPWMVDVASGIESAPGRKDPARLAAFVRAVRGASAPLPPHEPVNMPGRP